MRIEVTIRDSWCFLLYPISRTWLDMHGLRVILQQAAHATSKSWPTSTNTHCNRKVGGFVIFRLLYVIHNRLTDTLVKSRWKTSEYKLSYVQDNLELQFRWNRTQNVPRALTRKCEPNLKKAVNRPPTNCPYYKIPGCFNTPGLPCRFL